MGLIGLIRLIGLVRLVKKGCPGGAAHPLYPWQKRLAALRRKPLFQRYVFSRKGETVEETRKRLSRK